MIVFGLPKVDFIGFARDNHLASAADGVDYAIRMECVEKHAGQLLGHKGLNSCSRASENVPSVYAYLRTEVAFIGAEPYAKIEIRSVVWL